MTSVDSQLAPPAPAMPGDLMTPWQRVKMVLVLGSLIAVGPLTIDMYLPALPAITDDLLTNAAAVQLTLTGTLAGVALGQLLIGPLSDAVGRRRPLLAGAIVHVIASLLCALAPNVAVLGALRVVQGLAVSAAAVVAMAVVRDLFSGLGVARVLSRLMLVMGVAPVLAPTLGGEVLRWTDWRGVFVALAGISVILLAITAFGLPETLPPERRRHGGLAGTARAYGWLLRDRPFVGLVLVTGLAMAAVFAYVAGSSFVFQEQYGMSEQGFAVVFGLGAIGLVAASQLNVVLLRYFRPARIMIASVAAGALCALALLLFAVTGFGGLPAILVPLWGVLATVALINPNAAALAMGRHGEAAGTAAALLGSAQFGVGAVAAPLVGAIGTGGAAMAAVVAASMVLALAALLLIVRPASLVTEVPAVAPATAH
ncbi:multidrug effflux MFS transporter [Polymorphospora rubra]|uniref:Putative multidrug resistance transporter, Bcr/CflA family protein n=1 Tax=Polymorphospora rubra TaxID=338584 RepID=A0A810ND21_9ACTN|nr:multidrug effflux MFS transporter [Polymorphospora rubra]BCJ69778.1 putative multidrug resistance transporter, Bcr/CflA family protein [Polymorphospora rubra]